MRYGTAPRFSFEWAYSINAKGLTELAATDDRREGTTALLEKCKPIYTGY